MKREIKFRAWDKVQKEMIFDGIEYQLRLIGHICKDSETQERSQIGFSNFDFDRFEIMQFTGSTDKNGKEIYEGDILKCVDEFNENEKVIEVVFKNGGYCIEWDGMFYDGSDITLISWANETGIEFEIIGNIYENSELL